ncbi:unnamed protein product, partial [Ectocarpus sp. 13 AM-2016]
TNTVLVCAYCTHVARFWQERKRNAQRKINEVDAELLALTNVNVHRSFAISDSVSATNHDRRYTGTADPQLESVYAAPPPGSTVTTTTHSAAPPSYHDFVGGVTQVHIQ